MYNTFLVIFFILKWKSLHFIYISLKKIKGREIKEDNRNKWKYKE